MALRDQLAELNAALKSGRNAKRLRPLHPAVDEPAIEPRATHWKRIGLRERLRVIVMALRDRR